MPKKINKPTDKEKKVDSEPNFKKHPSSEKVQTVKISIPQSFKDYLNSLDNYNKKLTDDSKEISKKQGGN
jgi:hypothetical protein